MRILGIDPGSQVTGYGVIEVGPGGSCRLVALGAVRPKKSLPFFDRLLVIQRGVEGVVREWCPEEGAIEGIFHAAHARSALQLGHARAAALLPVLATGIAVHEYAPAEVKKAVAGYGRADKEQVQTMVRRLLGVHEPIRPLDTADALAVAICHSTSVAYRRSVGAALESQR